MYRLYHPADVSVQGPVPYYDKVFAFQQKPTLVGSFPHPSEMTALWETSDNFGHSLKNPTSDKYVALSMLHKGVRRGMADLARRGVWLLCNSDLEMTAVNRLLMIAQEDCGVMGLGVMHELVRLKVEGMDINMPKVQFLMLMATRLAMGPKDRTLCDLSSVHESGSAELVNTSEMIDVLSPAELRDILVDGKAPVMSRWLAHRRLLAKSDKSFVNEAYEMMGLPKWVRALVSALKSASKSDMCFGIPIALEMASKGGFAIEGHDLPKPSMGPQEIPLCVFDQFTFIGKKANASFAKHIVMKKVLDQLPGKMPSKLEYALFAAESGRLDCTFDYPGRSQLLKQVLVEEFASVGLSFNQACELTKAVEAQRAALDSVRALATMHHTFIV